MGCHSTAAVHDGATALHLLGQKSIRGSRGRGGTGRVGWCNHALGATLQEGLHVQGSIKRTCRDRLACSRNLKMVSLKQVWFSKKAGMVFQELDVLFGRLSIPCVCVCVCVCVCGTPWLSHSLRSLKHVWMTVHRSTGQCAVQEQAGPLPST